MPYLACPGCRLTVYNPPTVAEPEHCPRCGVRLAARARSLFASRFSRQPSGAQIADSLRRRVARRGELFGD
jgi:hypothetical protein